MTTKVCNVCQKECPIGEFCEYYVKARNKTYIESRCRTCKNNNSRKYMKQRADLEKQGIEYKRKRNKLLDYSNKKKAPLSGEDQIIHRQKETEQKRQYFQKNRDHLLEARRNYTREKMKDPIERIKRNMKTLLVMKIKKQYPSSTYFGTDIETICKWLEYNFKGEMSWDNYGEYWHMDHIIPIKLWDLAKEDEKLICFNWKNITPFPAIKNIKKGHSLQLHQVFFQEISVRRFCKELSIKEDINVYFDRYSNKLKQLLPEYYMRHTPTAGTSVNS
jgi:hypothetical protein